MSIVLLEADPARLAIFAPATFGILCTSAGMEYFSPIVLQKYFYNQRLEQSWKGKVLVGSQRQICGDDHGGSRVCGHQGETDSLSL